MARPDQLPKVLTEPEITSLLEQPNQRYFGPHRDYLYMRIMLKAGLRASEAVSLQTQVATYRSASMLQASTNRNTFSSKPRSVTA
jgi:integrase/recombinase XerD